MAVQKLYAGGEGERGRCASASAEDNAMRRVKVKEERGGGLAFPPCFCYLITYASPETPSPPTTLPHPAPAVLRSYCVTQ